MDLMQIEAQGFTPITFLKMPPLLDRWYLKKDQEYYTAESVTVNGKKMFNQPILAPLYRVK